MTEGTEWKEELKAAIEGRRHVRAAALAKLAALPISEEKDLQEKALWQMAAVYRNAGGARVLCEQYGFSNQDAESLLRRYEEEQRNREDKKTLEPTYDHTTGKYLTFEEWLAQFLKRWDKLSPS